MAKFGLDCVVSPAQAKKTTRILQDMPELTLLCKQATRILVSIITFVTVIPKQAYQQIPAIKPCLL